MAQISVQVSEEAERGYLAVHQTLDEFERIRELNHHTRGQFDSLSDRVRTIGDVVRTIEEIAEKTNLLALNASIIAAQAGEQGRGFAIVAQEIKLLSQQTAASTSEIVRRIRAIREESERAVEAMATSMAAIDQGFKVALRAGDVLAGIRERAHLTRKKARGVMRAVERQADGSAHTVILSSQVSGTAIALSTAFENSGGQTTHLRDEIEALNTEMQQLDTTARAHMTDCTSLLNILSDAGNALAMLTSWRQQTVDHCADVQQELAGLTAEGAIIEQRLSSSLMVAKRVLEQLGALAGR
jgi:methyl-accepting chemotaxis protein